MRTIKFRGKCTDTKDWVYGDYFKTPLTDENSGLPPESGWFFLRGGEERHCIGQDGVAFTVDPESVGQFTGLKDSKGKDVFEGDIVRQSLGFSSYQFHPPYHPTQHDGYGTIGCIGTIIFKDGLFVFRCDKVLKETSPWHDEYNLTRHFLNRCFDIKGCEIIGTIYDLNNQIPI